MPQRSARRQRRPRSTRTTLSELPGVEVVSRVYRLLLGCVVNIISSGNTAVLHCSTGSQDSASARRGVRFLIMLRNSTR